MLQSRWETLGLRSDLKASAVLLEPYVMEWSTCRDLQEMIGERYILQRSVQKLQDYIVEVETLLRYGGLVAVLKTYVQKSCGDWHVMNLQGKRTPKNFACKMRSLIKREHLANTYGTLK